MYVAMGSILEVSTGGGLRAGVLHSAPLKVRPVFLSYRFQPFHRDLPSSLAPGPVQAQPFPLHIPYIISLSSAFSNAPGFVRPHSLISQQSRTDRFWWVWSGVGVKWGPWFLQLRLPSPRAFLSVLSGICVTASQSYLPHFKTAELIFAPHRGAHSQ